MEAEFMLNRKFIFSSYIIIILAISIILLVIYRNASLESGIIKEVRKNNPQWGFKSGKCIVEEKRDKLSFIIQGPGINKLNMIDNLNIWYAVLKNISVDNLSFLRKSSNLERLTITEAPNLKDFSALKGKNLTNVHINQVPFMDFSVLQNMPIEILVIHASNLLSFESIKLLKNLRWLDLANCKNLKDISPLEDIVTLNYISLSNTPIDNIEALKNLKMLKNIYLNDTQVSDLTPLTGMHLEYLDIRNSPAASKSLPEGLIVKHLVK